MRSVIFFPESLSWVYTILNGEKTQDGYIDYTWDQNDKAKQMAAAVAKDYAKDHTSTRVTMTTKP